MDIIIDYLCYYVHIGTMNIAETLKSLGQRLKARRIALGITQRDAADRSGVAYRTWRRMENHGKASIEDLYRAAIILRCENAMDDLFPMPVASSMDELLKAQKAQSLQSASVRHRVTSPRGNANVIESQSR